MNTPAWYQHQLRILELQRKRDRSVALAWARLAEATKAAPKGLAGVQEAIARIHDEYDAELMKAWEAYVTEAQAHGGPIALACQGQASRSVAAPARLRHVWREGRAWVSAQDLYVALGQRYSERDRRAINKLPVEHRAHLKDLGAGVEMHAQTLVVSIEWAIGLCRARGHVALADWLSTLRAEAA